MQVATSAGTDYAYIGMNLQDPVLSHLEVRKAIGYAIDRDAIVNYLRRGFATTAVGIVPPMSWAFERNVFDFRHDPAEAERLLDAAGYPDPDGAGPLPRLHLSLKTSTSEVYRLQAAAIQHDLARVGIALEVRSSELQTLSADVRRGNFQLYTLQWVGVTDPDMLRLVYHSGQQPPVGLEPGALPQPGRGSPDRRSVGGDRRTAPRRVHTRRAQQLIAEDVPYISLLVQDQRRDLPARHPRRIAFADRGLHVPEERLSRCRSRSAPLTPRHSSDAQPTTLASSSAPVCPSATRSFSPSSLSRSRCSAAARAQTPASRVDAALGTVRYDPALRFRTISTARFDIYFHQREEALARRLAGFVEEVAAEIDGRLGAPRGRVHVILVDQTDQSNGWATVFPYNTDRTRGGAAPVAEHDRECE